MKRFVPPLLFLLVMMACEPKSGNIEAEYALGPRAVVVGDSLSNTGRVTLHAELGKVFATKIAAISGSRYSTMLPYSETYAADRADVAVIALGTNDRQLPHNLTASLEGLNQTYDLFAESCTVGITVTTDHPNPEVNIKASAINDAASSRADVMVDWDGYDHELGITQTDGTHPTQEGYRLRAELIAAAASTCGQIRLRLLRQLPRLRRAPPLLLQLSQIRPRLQCQIPHCQNEPNHGINSFVT